jgi:micrococcal nuclease
VSLTSSVARGGTASITVKTAAGAACTIEVDYKSGPSTSSSLTPKTAPSTGLVSWSWKVGTTTTPGTWPIHVTCSSGDATGTLETRFTVT